MPGATIASPVHRVLGRCATPAAGDDVYFGSNAYPFPAAAAATNIISGSANDAAAGTGARTVRVWGIASASTFALVSEDVTMNGLTQVALTTQFYRVLGADVLTAGSGGVAAGAISVRHGTTALAQILAGQNTALPGVWTVPDVSAVNSTSFRRGRGTLRSGVLTWWCSAVDLTAGHLNLLARTPGGVWSVIDHLVTPAFFPVRNGEPLVLPVGTDLRVNVVAATAELVSMIEVGWVDGLGRALS